MKIAYKIKYLAIILGTFALAGSFVAQAADPVPPAPGSSTTATVDVAPPSSAPPVSPPLLNTNGGLTGASGKNEKGLAAAEEKVSDSVKSVVKHLNRTADDVTLDDLNSARQAVAKLEALIDIEKRISELEKIRQEREGGGSLAAAIPASALRPSVAAPPMPMSSSPSATPAVAMPAPAPGVMELSRVIGSTGHYSAVIKMSDGQLETGRVGDRLSDGSVISKVTMKEVELKQGAAKRTTLRVKNVNTVVGSSF
ncbi:MAG: hypothetical protein SFW62_03135 [Alphaproteobacteria bacterium]|nr:hypothetical protein [Alphaproteobacteria bacterium]